MICYGCGKIGHKSEACPSILLEHQNENQHEQDMEDVHMSTDIRVNHEQKPEEENTFGSWMQVKKPQAKRRSSKQEKNEQERGKEGQSNNGGKGSKSKELQKENERGSRFSILDNMAFDLNNGVTENNGNCEEKSQGGHSSQNNPLTNELARVNLGESSQIKLDSNPFNLGKSTLANQEGETNSPKSWQEIRKQNKKKSKSILKDISNEGKINDQNQEISSQPLSQEKENIAITFQATQKQS